MRPCVIRMAVLAVSVFPICGCKSKATSVKSNATASASAQSKTRAEVRARIGGQLVAVGDHTVELRLLKRGLVEGLVYDAHGKLIPDPSKAKLTVRAHTAARARAAIECGWEPAVARFSGRAPGDAELGPGPVDVELDLGGASAHTRLETPVLLVGPEKGGALFVAGKYGVELLATQQGRVEAVIHDAKGALVTGAVKTKFEVELSGADGKLHAISLAWNAARARFVGRVEGGAKLVAGPAKLEIDGEVAARLPSLALRVKAEHGGRVILAGDYSVELVAKGDLVSAYAFDASGQAHAKGDLDLELRVGDGAFVKLAWNAPSLSYQAKLTSALDFDVQPVVVAVRVGGKAFVGAYARADAKLDASAKLRGKAEVGAGAKAKAGLKVPSVRVRPPKVSVKVNKNAGASAKAGFSFGTR